MVYVIATPGGAIGTAVKGSTKAKTVRGVDGFMVSLRRIGDDSV